MNPEKKILLIERDAERVDYLKKFIPLLGRYELEVATHPIETLAKINAFEPELVIFAFGMPGLDGRVLAKEIRGKHPKTKLLVIAPNPMIEKTLQREGIDHVIALPFDHSDLSNKIKGLLPTEGRQEGEGARLLVVDDESGILTLFEDLFRPLGIEVYGASDAEEALRVFKEKGCNLAIVDLRLPKIRGTELIKTLEASTDPPPPKAILLMTTSLGDKQKEVDESGHSILTKPVDPDVLEETVLNLCQKYGLSVKKA